MTEGRCHVKGCQAAHHSLLMIVFIGECLIVGINEAMEEIVKLELLLMFTTSRLKLLTTVSMLHNVLKLIGKPTLCSVADASYAENALLHVPIVVALQKHVRHHVIDATFTPGPLRQLKMEALHP